MPSDAQVNLPGFLTFEEFMKPSQAKWFKNAKGNMAGIQHAPDLLYQQWLDMLRQRQAAAKPPVTPPPGGGGGSPAGAAPPPGGAPKPGQPNGNGIVPGGAPRPSRPRTKPNGLNPTPQTGGGLVPGQPAQPPLQPNGGKSGGPGIEQAAPGIDPAMANIMRILRAYQGGGRSMMGGKG